MTDFEKFVNYVEAKTRIKFYAELAQQDDIDEYKQDTGRDLEYVVGNLGEVRIILGHSFGEKGDEDFMFAIDDPQEPEIYEGISSWKEAAENCVRFISIFYFILK